MILYYVILSSHHVIPNSLYVILNIVKNLSVCTNIESLTPLEILRSAQDDNVECKHTLHVIRNVSLHHDILNVVKNLSVCTNIESLTPLEILRFAQDDKTQRGDASTSSA